MFWGNKSYKRTATSINDDSHENLSYDALSENCEQISKFLSVKRKRQLGLLFCDNTTMWLCAYISILRSGNIPLLVPSSIKEQYKADLIENFHISWEWKVENVNCGSNFFENVKSGFKFYNSLHEELETPELALMLGTSGTTGSPKYVMISYRALQANADSISKYLNLSFRDKCLTTLPPSYSYGLSVINSHLNSEASIRFSNLSPMNRGFYEVIDKESVTNISGVPTLYEMYWRTGMLKKQFSNLRFITQAGGHLKSTIKEDFSSFCSKNNIEFFVMYGQTEATARMSYVPPKALHKKIESIGVPIPGGEFSIDSKTSELIYKGDNVMSGYAENFNEVSNNYKTDLILKTGDLAKKDSDGYYYITGRIKRIIKINGLRFNLDEIEKTICSSLDEDICVTGKDGKLCIAFAKSNRLDNESILTLIKPYLKELNLFKHQYEVIEFNKLPKLSNGKINYKEIIDSIKK